MGLFNRNAMKVALGLRRELKTAGMIKSSAGRRILARLQRIRAAKGKSTLPLGTRTKRPLYTSKIAGTRVAAVRSPRRRGMRGGRYLLGAGLAGGGYLYGSRTRSQQAQQYPPQY